MASSLALNAQPHVLALPKSKGLALLNEVLGEAEDYIDQNGDDCNCDNPRCVRAVDSNGRAIPGGTFRIPKGCPIYLSCVSCPGAQTPHKAHYECRDCRESGAMAHFDKGRFDCVACIATSTRKNTIASEWLNRPVRDERREAINDRTHEAAATIALRCQEIAAAADAEGIDQAERGGRAARAEAMHHVRNQEDRHEGESLEAFIARKRQLEEERTQAQRALERERLAAGRPENVPDDDPDLPPLPEGPEGAAAAARIEAAKQSLDAKVAALDECRAQVTRARTRAIAAQEAAEQAASNAAAQVEALEDPPSAAELAAQAAREAAKETKRQKDRERRERDRNARESAAARQEEQSRRGNEAIRRVAQLELDVAAANGKATMADERLAEAELALQAATAEKNSVADAVADYFEGLGGEEPDADDLVEALNMAMGAAAQRARRAAAAAAAAAPPPPPLPEEEEQGEESVADSATDSEDEEDVPPPPGKRRKVAEASSDEEE